MRNPEELARALAAACIPFIAAVDYDPGMTDLYNEQPLLVSVTLGDYRTLRALAREVAKAFPERRLP